MSEQLIEKLGAVDDPELGDDIVSLDLVGEVEIADGVAHVPLAFGAPYSPVESEIADQVRSVVRDSGYEPSLSVDIDDRTPTAKVDGAPIVIAVASGKGGVGKTTVAVNLATAIADQGAHVGLFDADVYGPNVPRMVGLQNSPARAEDEMTLLPLEQHGVKVMSVGFLVGEDDPAIWRGPMVDKVLTQLWHETDWGELDYMVVDLPPGTGDAQLTMLQQMPVTGAVVVTTPQPVAVDNARKGIRMFDEHDTSVLGIVENMSTFVCPDCEGTHDVFDSGGGTQLSSEFERPLLAEIPLDPSVQQSGNEGVPTVLREKIPSASAFEDLAENVLDEVGAVRRHSHHRQIADTGATRVKRRTHSS